jgi:hypothetical protein
MSNFKICISDEVEKRFRHAAMSRFGYTRGALSLAAEQALTDWSRGIADVEEVRAIIKSSGTKDWVSELRGVLKHVKKTSVELKHGTSKIRSERAMRYAHRY